MPQYCLVKHRISTYVIDGDDADHNPDRIPVTGGVTFTPILNKGDSVVVTENGIATTITLAPIEARITNGELYHRGEEGVKLFAGGPTSNPERIRYRAAFHNLIADGQKVELKNILFEAVPGGELSLAVAQSVPGAPYPGYSASIEAGIAEIGLVRDGAIDFAVMKINETRDEVLGEVGEAIQDAKDANALDRVAALEAMGGLSPESPVDGQTANLVAQPGTLTAAALTKKFSAAEVVGQPDYVSLMAARSSYSKMTVTKVDNGILNITCASENDERSVVYSLTAPERYRYIGLVRGTATGATPRIILVDELDLQGTYLGQAPGSAWFTTEVGATWSVEITTSGSSDVGMQTYTDTRGGVWRISVDGHPELSATVSTWREDAGHTWVDLFTIPIPGTYTIRGEFLGEDPENPPSTGAARGWLTSEARDFLSATNATAEGAYLADLSPVSNKDFAFRMRPAGTESNFEFVPYHGTESEVFASPTRYYVGGSPLDVDALPDWESVPIESFEVVQHIYGRNASAPDPSQNIAEIWTTQKFLADGTYHASGRWRPLVDLEMGNGSYPMMLPGYLAIFDEVISSVGTTHAVSGDDTPRKIPLTDEQDLAEGYAMLSSTSDFVAAVQVDARRETLRTGASDKAADMAWIELRAGGHMAKVYQSIYALGAVVPAGQMHRFSGRFWYGAAPGMRSVLSLS